VRDPGGLKVEVDDHGVVCATRGSNTRHGWSRRRRLLRRCDALPRRGVEEVLRLGNLASKSVSCGTLVLPGEGSHTHALLGGGCRGLGVLQGRSEGAVIAATTVGCGDSPRRKAVAEKGPVAGGIL
jgi:hypothetical protein